MQTEKYISIAGKRAKLMRYDTAVILKRFFFCEHSILISEAGWIAGTAPLLLKTMYAHMLWEDAMTADAMRQRVFELRYPSRLMEKEGEEPLIQLLDEARNAPNPLAFFLTLIKVFKPALRDAYQSFLDLADVIGDGPSVRFMRVALDEKARQIETLESFLPEMLKIYADKVDEANAWFEQVALHLDALGSIGLNPIEAETKDPVELPNRKPFGVAQVPDRDPRFTLVRYYWPDIVDPEFPYGEGLRLQLRSAISHVNEVWAVEACSAFLYAFADTLGWEFVFDSARWTYDESRHCRMGYERLMAWGYDPSEIPLGTYIYDAARDEDPIYRLGMLYFFETKNINKKPRRAEKFKEYSDTLSQHDMDFDWADETIHAHYGNKWLTKLLEVRGGNTDPKVVRTRCGELVDNIVADVTDEEKVQIRKIAEAMIAKAEKMVISS